MATQKQIEANRRNAAKSTGPKTDAGRMKCRLNSLKHGLGAIHVPLPHENPTEYHDLRHGLVETYQPANTQEQMLVDNIASAYLRMQRAGRFEAALMNGLILTVKDKHGKSLDPDPSDDLGVIIAMADRNLEQAWLLLDRYEKRAQSAYYKGIETLRKLQKDRRNEPIREMREAVEKERYLKRTVAPKLASFGHPDVDTISLPFSTNPQPSTPVLESCPAHVIST